MGGIDRWHCGRCGGGFNLHDVRARVVGRARSCRRPKSKPERYPLESIAFPVLTIAAEDDLFGTDEAARYVAANAHRRAHADVRRTDRRVRHGHALAAGSRLEVFGQGVPLIALFYDGLVVPGALILLGSGVWPIVSFMTDGRS
jgi:hypothetical protein